MSKDYRDLAVVQQALVESNTQVLELQEQLQEMYAEKARRLISKQSAQRISEAKSARCKELLARVGYFDDRAMHVALMQELQKYLYLTNVIPMTMYKGLEVNVHAALSLIKTWEPCENNLHKWIEEYLEKRNKKKSKVTPVANVSNIYHYGVNYLEDDTGTV